MKPIDYIYKNLYCFNLPIFKQILAESGEEVSESIYDYLMETTWNTNPTFLKQFGLDIVRTKEESGEDKEGPMYVIKLAKYGEGMEVYAEDSPWKPTAEELEEVIQSIMFSVLRNMGYESVNNIPSDKIDEAQLNCITEINSKVNIYSLQNNKLNALMLGIWYDTTMEEYSNGEKPSEVFGVQRDNIVYQSADDNGHDYEPAE